MDELRAALRAIFGQDPDVVFDLSSIPPEAKITRATLDLSPGVHVTIKGEPWPADDDPSWQPYNGGFSFHSSDHCSCRRSKPILLIERMDGSLRREHCP